MAAIDDMAISIDIDILGYFNSLNIIRIALVVELIILS